MFCRYLDFEELSWARLALGPDWMPPKGTAKDVAGDLSLPRQVLAATTPKNMSVGAQARTGMGMVRHQKLPAQNNHQAPACMGSPLNQLRLKTEGASARVTHQRLSAAVMQD